MENMDKGLAVPKWVLVNWPKMPKMPQNSIDTLRSKDADR